MSATDRDESAIREQIIRTVLRDAVGRAVNPHGTTLIGAVAVTTHHHAPGSGLALAGTSNVHAETAAITAVLPYREPILELWLASNRDEHITPCGGCRQFVADVSAWQGHPITVVSHLDGAPQRRYALDDLLPDAFTSARLARLGLVT